MARTFVRQDTQIRQSDTYDDQKAAGSTLESSAAHIEDDLNGLRSQVNRIINNVVTGNDWFANVTSRGVNSLHTDLADIEAHKILCRTSLLTDISVGATDNWVVLSFAGAQTPTQVAAVALTQNGAVVAQSALSGAGFAVNELTEISGVNAISPKNLLVIRSAVNGQIIQSSGRDVFGLLQYESTGVDGAAFNDTSGGNRAKISFIRQTSGFDDLEACPAADIQGQAINYSYVSRINLDAMPEDCFLADGSFVDVSAATDVTRQRAYDNQGTTPVELATNADLDLGATREWAIRDLLNADLLRVIEGSTGGVTKVQIHSDVDTFDVDALVNDFAEGVTVDSGGIAINLGVATAGSIGTAGSNDLRIFGAGELYLDDGNQTGSTWAQTDGIKLSNTTAEWDLFETNFGEVSLLSALNQAVGTGARGTKVYANVTATTTANSDVGGVGGGANLDAQLPSFFGGSFLIDYDVFLNGNLLRPGADASANNDYYPGTSLPNGQLRFEFSVKISDVICVIPYA
jgi:hypothetical protein